MSSQSIKSPQENDTNRRLSGSSSERIIFYVDDASYEVSHEISPDYCQRSLHDCYTLCPTEDRRASLYPSCPDITGYQSNDHSVLCSSIPDETRFNASIHSKIPKQSRKNSETDQRSSRRSSVQSSRSRTNSCSRPTPLGNGRRSSTSRPRRPRRASTGRRKDSVRPLKAREAQKIVEDVRILEQARRHRRVAMIVLGTFLFILVASVLVVVVTLTHSTFLSPVMGSMELAEHRAQLRKENEELFNSLNRVIVTENVTTPP